ncbi:NAD(P)-dependent oxidoreductase, partial [Lacisediminihabitans profunda]
AGWRGLRRIALRQKAVSRKIRAGHNRGQSKYRTRPPVRELTFKAVGLIGFGPIGWRLREFLAPFECPFIAYDPYAPRELADAQRVDFASLATVLGRDVVV